MSEDNKQMPLISGQSTTGKSASLRNIRDQENWWYLNSEAGKRLPFRSKFQEFRITEPAQVTEAFDVALQMQTDQDADMPKGIIVDSLSFLMDMKETQDVYGSSNTQSAWGDFAQYLKMLMQEKAAKLDIPVIFLAHTLTVYDDEGKASTAVPIKGSLKNQGVEAYFSLVVSTKRMTIKDLEAIENHDTELLKITEDERLDGFKHVFQCRLTPRTVGERIRAPMGMFSREQTFMDNDVQLLLDHVNAYYNG